MTRARRMAIFDNHIHLRTEFKGVDAAKAFEKAGGTAFLLTHSPYEDIPITRAADYVPAYEKTLDMADRVRAATSVNVFVALGPYPVEFLRLYEVHGPEASRQMMEEAVDLAARHIEDGRATAFGEIGRPHFPVGSEVVEACNDIMAYAMATAKRLGCAVILHTEDLTPHTFSELAAIASRTGLDRRRVVKHHSTPLTRPEDTHGLVPSILAKEELIVEALKGGPNFLLETDYIDDPHRPGAVLGPATVPKKTRAWIDKGLLSEEAAWTIHVEMPERTYGIDLRV